MSFKTQDFILSLPKSPISPLSNHATPKISLNAPIPGNGPGGPPGFENPIVPNKCFEALGSQRVGTGETEKLKDVPHSREVSLISQGRPLKLLVSVFIFWSFFFGLPQIFNLPPGIQEARAAVTILDPWSGETIYATERSFSPSAGTDRLVLIAVTAEKNASGPMDINQVTLGDAVLTGISEFTVGDSGAYHNLLWLGYLDDAGISGRTGSGVSITYFNAPNNPFDEPKIYYATYQNIDQSTPIAASASNSSTSASTLQAGDISAGTGDKVVYAALIGEPYTHTAPSGYTKRGELVGGTNGHAIAVADRDATTSST